MTEAADPVTVALTGQLPFYLLLAAILTWPIAIGLLRLYTRAVRRSMRTSASRQTSSMPAQQVETAGDAPRPGEARPHAAFYDLPATTATREADTLMSLLMSRPRRAALVHVFGGVTYGVVMALAQLLADGLEIRPIRFLMLFWVFLWPVVLTVGIVAAATRYAKVFLVAAYFVCLFAIGGAAMPNSPDLTWAQVAMSWAMFDLPPTILMATYLSRRVRAVGPLVATFIVVALIGSHVGVAIAGTDERYLRALIELTDMVGLGGVGTFWALIMFGFMAFAVVGWVALGWIRRQYQAKRISDQSVTIDAIWMLFTISHSINLVFGGPLWALAGLGAFVAYKVCVRFGLKWAGSALDLTQRNPALLVLRSFSIGKDGERLFDVVDRFWRRVGPIEMIAGIDLAHRTVEPHEFLDFISGRLSRRFIDGSAVMEQRMQERDTKPDRDLRFRVNDFFCYDDTWKMVLSRLVRQSDAVLMDLRGFSRQNAGCVFELTELARIVPLERVVFVVDRRTDENLLAEALGECRAGVYRLDSITERHVRQLMRSLASAAAPMEPTAA
ncbi:MAG: hypothetical protein ABIS29_11875 [Vicinamibacterales bacterium]